jgi:hypothetical protein
MKAPNARREEKVNVIKKNDQRQKDDNLTMILSKTLYLTIDRTETLFKYRLNVTVLHLFEHKKRQAEGERAGDGCVFEAGG